MSDPHQQPRPDFTKAPHEQPGDPYAHGGQDGWGQQPHPEQQPYPYQPYQEQPYPQEQHQQQYAPYPQHQQPSAMSVQDERTWAVLSHVSSLLVWVGLPVVGPLVLFLVFKDRSRFVREHSAEALNLNISMLLYGLGLTVVAALLALFTFGLSFALLGLLPVATTVLTVLAAVAANSGRAYRYPAVLHLVR
ncbi:hypothetical protein GCM10027586_14550 [Kineococcus gypseus]|uniref:DUF4870 domain-containing protein n=1 Tax=Kineococcus gypseus TaxID=1637102 RepID=UPI003D7DC9AC